MEAMKPPMYVGHLPSDEQRRLEKGLRSRDAFELRRCQILLASARGGRPSQIAAHLGCTPQTVRNTIRAYWADALLTSSLVETQDGRADAGRSQVRTASSDLARNASIVWKADQSVDASLGGRGLLRAGRDLPKGQYRFDPSRLATDGRRMEARQTLDHESRPALSPVPYEKPYQAASCRGFLTPIGSLNNVRIVSNARRKAPLVSSLSGTRLNS